MIKNIAKSTATSVVCLAVALVMFGAMKNTRPSNVQHADAVSDVVEKVVTEIFEDRIEVPEESRQLAEHLSSEVIPKAIEKVSHGKIDLTDFWIFNIGTITEEDGDEEAVSIGILGKVFTFNEGKIRENIEDMVASDMKEFMEAGKDSLELNNGVHLQQE